MNDKISKTRTSITIDPQVLASAKEKVSQPNSGYKSFSDLVEVAVNKLLEGPSNGKGW